MDFQPTKTDDSRGSTDAKPVAASYLVRFYRDEDLLLDVIAEFVQAGLAAGESCLLITTKSRTAQVKERLRAGRLDCDVLERIGMILAVDSEDTLARIMRDTGIDGESFRTTVGDLIRQIRRSSNQQPFRVYVDMVDLLSRNGNARAAIGLEQLWNQLQREEAFSLLRAYTDITGREQVEEVLRQSESRERKRSAELSAIMEAVPAVVWIARDPECRVIEGNRASHEFLRLPSGANPSLSAPDGERPTNFEVLVNGIPLKPEELPVQRAARGEEVHDCEEEVRFDDGTSRHLFGNAVPLRDENGAACGAVSAFVDITGRKQAEEALRAGKAELDAVVNQTPFMLALCGRDMKYRFVSQAYAGLLGLRQEEIAGKPIAEVIGEEAFQTLLPHIQQVLAGNTVEFEGVLSLGDTGERYLRITYTPEFSSAGDVLGWVASVLDLTAQKNAEKSWRESVRQQSALYHYVARLQGAESLTDIYDAAIGAILEALRCDRASVLVRDATGIMRFVAWRGLSDSYRSAVEGHSPWLPDQGDPQPVCIPDTASAELEESLRAVLKPEGIGSLAFVPLVTQGRLIGKFMTYYNAPHAFDRLELDLGLAIARQLSLAIQRKQAEAAVRERQERYELVVQGAEAAIWDWDVPAGRVVYSPRWKQMRGLSEAEVTESEEEWSGRIHPEDRSRVMDAVKAHLDGRTPTFSEEYRVQHKDGRWIWILDRGIARRDASGQVIRMAGSETDITERKRAEEALRESEERFRIMADSSPVPIWVSDADGGVLFVNRAYSQLFGVALETLHATGWQPLIHPDDLDGYASAFMQAVRERRPFRAQCRIRSADGGWRWIDSVGVPRLSAAGELLGVVGSSFDITEMKRTQDALRASDGRFRQLLSLMPTAVYTCDLEGRITFFNQRATELWGRSPKLGDSDQRFCGALRLWRPDGSLMPHAETPMAAALRDGTSTRNGDAVIERPDHTRIAVSANVEPLCDAEGRRYGAVNVCQDVTDLKHAAEKLEAAVRERTASLQEAVAQMEEFSYAVSHDLRAPLRTINAYAEALAEDYSAQLDETAKEYLQRIQRGSDRMEKLSRDILAYSRTARTEVTLSAVRVEQLVRDITHQYVELQPPRAEIRLEGLWPEVLAHEVSLGQCISNLLTNAVKFVNPGTLPRVRVFAEARGEKVRIWVEDNGIGIPEQYHSRLFRVFERLHNDDQYEGTGIGLALVRKAMEKMGGSCGVESDGERGSRFWLELSAG
jgi:PAS domain S-box-containing protein